ncbi:MAG: hypothetical protein CM15mV59_0020 [Caudoviricetes sp.]|nr:MAG: hypothetical protein CM15mV59_0020 [Caudoviricetes sp.]
MNNSPTYISFKAKREIVNKLINLNPQNKKELLLEPWSSRILKKLVNFQTRGRKNDKRTPKWGKGFKGKGFTKPNVGVDK